jgi:uncharacterized protein DUF4011
VRLRDNEKVAFVPVPEPDLDTDDLPNEKDYADELGWSTSFDLDPSSVKADSGRFLPVLHYPERLDTLSRKIGSAAKTAIEESGTNMLHLVFGSSVAKRSGSQGFAGAEHGGNFRLHCDVGAGDYLPDTIDPLRHDNVLLLDPHCRKSPANGFERPLTRAGACP